MSRLTSNILWNLSGQGVLLLLGLLAVRFIFKQLGADAFGLILFAQTAAVVMVALFDLGISATITREVATRLAGERGYVIDLLRTATLIYWSAYLLLVVGLIVVTPALVTHWIHLKTIDVGTATQVMRILGCGALLTLPRSLYASLFRGMQEMAYNNLIEAGALAMQQLGIIAILAWAGARWQMTGVALWFGASYALSLVAYIVAARRFVPGRALMPGYSAAVLQRNLGYGGQMMSNSALAIVHSQLDKVLVSKLMPIGTLGTYGFAATLVAGMARVTSSIVQAAFPSFSGLHARLERGGLIRQYQRVHELTVVATAPLFAALAFAGAPVLTYVFDAAIARALMAPLILLCLGSYMNATLSAPYTLSVAMGRPQIAVRQNVLALFVVVPVAVALVIRFGIVGAGASWVVYHLFAYAYGLPRICRECIHQPVLSWYRHAGKAFGLIAATYGVGFVIARGSNSAVLAAVYVVATFVYLLASYLLTSEDIRLAARRALRGWTRWAEAA